MAGWILMVAWEQDDSDQPAHAHGPFESKEAAEAHWPLVAVDYGEDEAERARWGVVHWATRLVAP